MKKCHFGKSVPLPILRKSDSVHEVDDHGEHAVGAFVHFNTVPPISHIGVQGSLEVIRPSQMIVNWTCLDLWLHKVIFIPQLKDERVSLNRYTLTVESDISIGPVLPQLCDPGHQLRCGDVHPVRLLISFSGLSNCYHKHNSPLILALPCLLFLNNWVEVFIFSSFSPLSFLWIQLPLNADCLEYDPAKIEKLWASQLSVLSYFSKQGKEQPQHLNSVL